MSKQELSDCLKSFYTSARNGYYYKTSSMKSIRATIDRFLRSPPHCKQFSIIGDPAFTEVNQVLDAFVKDLRKMGKIAGVVHKKPITKQHQNSRRECLPSWAIFTPWKKISSLRVVSLSSTAKFNSPVLVCSLKVASLFSTTNFNTYSPVQTAQSSSYVVDRSSHDRSTTSATATSKFTTTTASPAERLIADIVTLFVRSKLWFFEETDVSIFFERSILSILIKDR